MNYILQKKPKIVFARALMKKHSKEDHAFIVLDYGKCVGSIETNWFMPYKMRNLTVTGSERVVEIDYIKQEVKIYDEKRIYRPKIKKEEPLKLEIKHFIESVVKNKKPLVPPVEAKDVLKIAAAAIKSNKKRSAIFIK